MSSSVHLDDFDKIFLKKHFEVKLDRKSLGERIDFSKYDFIYCGSGTEANEMVAIEDLLKRKDSFAKAVEKGTVILLTGGAMEFLGKSVNGKEALDLLPLETEFTDNRYTGDVIVRNDEIGEVVGFINKCSLIKEDEDIKLFDYVFKQNEVKDNAYEGYHYKNVYGTHIIGPILVKNPNFMKKIIGDLGGKDFIYKDISYPFEEDSYSVTLNALKERIK